MKDTAGLGDCEEAPSVTTVLPGVVLNSSVTKADALVVSTFKVELNWLGSSDTVEYVVGLTD